MFYAGYKKEKTSIDDHILALLAHCVAVCSLNDRVDSIYLSKGLLYSLFILSDGIRSLS